MGLDDKISNKGDDVRGKVKEAAGSAVGNESLEHEGKADQAKAALKDGVEKVKDAASDLKDGLTR